MSGQLFRRLDGQPIVFLMGTSGWTRQNVKKLVEARGGVVKDPSSLQDDGHCAVRFLVNTEMPLSDKYDLFSYRYMLDCIEENCLLPSLLSYRVTSHLPSPFQSNYCPMEIMLGHKMWSQVPRVAVEIPSYVNADEVQYLQEYKAFSSSLSLFSKEDAQEIVNYLVKRDLIQVASGNSVWRSMEKAGVCSGQKTASDMKTYFLQTIFPGLKNYGLTLHQVNKFRRVLGLDMETETETREQYSACGLFTSIRPRRKQSNCRKRRSEVLKSSDSLDLTMASTSHMHRNVARKIVKSKVPADPEDSSCRSSTDQEDFRHSILINPQESPHRVSANPQESTYRVSANSQEFTRVVSNNPQEFSEKVQNNPQDSSNIVSNISQKSRPRVSNNPQESSCRATINPQGSSNRESKNQQNSSLRISNERGVSVSRSTLGQNSEFECNRVSTPVSLLNSGADKFIPDKSGNLIFNVSLEIDTLVIDEAKEVSSERQVDIPKVTGEYDNVRQRETYYNRDFNSLKRIELSNPKLSKACIDISANDNINIVKRPKRQKILRASDLTCDNVETGRVLDLEINDCNSRGRQTNISLEDRNEEDDIEKVLVSTKTGKSLDHSDFFNLSRIELRANSSKDLDPITVLTNYDIPGSVCPAEAIDLGEHLMITQNDDDHYMNFGANIEAMKGNAEGLENDIAPHSDIFKIDDNNYVPSGKTPHLLKYPVNECLLSSPENLLDESALLPGLCSDQILDEGVIFQRLSNEKLLDEGGMLSRQSLEKKFLDGGVILPILSPEKLPDEDGMLSGQLPEKLLGVGGLLPRVYPGKNEGGILPRLSPEQLLGEDGMLPGLLSPVQFDDVNMLARPLPVKLLDEGGMMLRLSPEKLLNEGGIMAISLPEKLSVEDGMLPRSSAEKLLDEGNRMPGLSPEELPNVGGILPGLSHESFIYEEGEHPLPDIDPNVEHDRREGEKDMNSFDYGCTGNEDEISLNLETSTDEMIQYNDIESEEPIVCFRSSNIGCDIETKVLVSVTLDKDTEEIQDLNVNPVIEGGNCPRTRFCKVVRRRSRIKISRALDVLAVSIEHPPNTEEDLLMDNIEEAIDEDTRSTVDQEESRESGPGRFWESRSSVYVNNVEDAFDPGFSEENNVFGDPLNVEAASKLDQLLVMVVHDLPCGLGSEDVELIHSGKTNNRPSIPGSPTGCPNMETTRSKLKIISLGSNKSEATSSPMNEEDSRVKELLTKAGFHQSRNNQLWERRDHGVTDWQELKQNIQSNRGLSTHI